MWAHVCMGSTYMGSTYMGTQVDGSTCMGIHVCIGGTYMFMYGRTHRYVWGVHMCTRGDRHEKNTCVYGGHISRGGQHVCVWGHAGDRGDIQGHRRWQ